MFEGFLGRITRNADMSVYTTVGAGGRAEYLLEPRSEQQLLYALSELGEKTVIGAGSKLLFTDYGGAVIRFNKPLFVRSFSGERLRISAGDSLSSAARECAERGLKGLEFAAGIPGTVGGAVVMNAGCFGGEISNSLVSVDVYEGGEIKTLSNSECGFYYRGSRFKGGGATVLSAEFKLERASSAELLDIIAENARKRAELQPRGASFGSAFKRPEGLFAGELIERCGLKGARIGGAEVSSKHANFMLNQGGATYADFLSLLQAVESVVLLKIGVRLEREVIVL